MRGPKHEPGNSTPESEQPERPDEERDPARPGASGPAGATALVEQLTTAFAEQLRRALGVELDPGLGTTALAYVDHYLSLLREDPEGETREPIVSLVAANAGAWFGELIRREIGGTWIGDGKDPRRLRLLLEPAFVHFSPIDMAYEAIVSEALEPGDPRIPEGATLDSAFHLRKQPAPDHPDEPSDHEWIGDRLAEVPPVAEDQFFSLTGRFETLGLILALIASREHERGREPTRYHLNDYIAELSEA